MRVTSALKLEGRELDFTFAIACGYSPTKAATISGWAIGSAARLLAKPEILAALLAIEQNVGTTLARYRSRKAMTDAELSAPLMPLHQVARPNVDPDDA
jgi:hypothetical protein